LESVNKIIAPALENARLPDLTEKPWMPFLIASSALAFYVALPALLAALLFRGGLILRVAGVAFVQRDGSRPSRVRVFWRSLVAWSIIPIGVGIFLSMYSLSGSMLAAALAWGLVGFLCAASVALPGRGLQDRLAGTWPVMR
jgi:hypothetical protein